MSPLAGRILTGASGLKRRKVLKALRDPSSIPRKRLDSESRREAARLLQAVTPLRFRMVRFRPLSKYADERGQSHPAKASHSSEGGRNVDRPMSLNIP